MSTWHPGVKLDLLVCGHPIERIDGRRPYAFLVGNATRAFGLANQLAFQGFAVGLNVEPGCVTEASPLISSGLWMVPRPLLAQAAAGSRVLLLACTNLKTLRQRVPEALQLEHPRKWAACCFDLNDPEDLPGLTRGLTGICFNNEQQARVWDARGLGLPIHVQAYGVDENAYVDAAIRATDRPMALWMGVFRRPRQLERIVRFAELNPECEVQVVSGLFFDQQQASGTHGSLDDPYINAQAHPSSLGNFHQVTRLWCGRAAPPNVCFLGPCTGRNDELLGGAQIALGFSRGPEQSHDDSKILDYLRAGVPVLCDDGQPAHRFVQAFGHGAVLPFRAGDEALREGYLKCLELSSVDKRRRIAGLVRDRYGWSAAARNIATWIREDVPDGLEPSQAEPVQPSPGPVPPTPRLLYIPWIDGHTGALVRLLEAAGDTRFLPLDLGEMIPGQTGAHRFEIMALANEDPARFQALLAQLVDTVREPVNALMVTADWSPGLRQAVHGFRSAGFPTLLVPHESVFARENLYYRDPATGVELPEAETALLWGGLQADIFQRRGLDPRRMRVVGSPKLDFVAHYRSSIPRQDFYARWELASDRPVILFATQPMDLQFDTTQALEAQSRAIADCLAVARKHDFQLIVRLPPARSEAILGSELVEAVRGSRLAALDGAKEGNYRATPHDAVFHADVVVSVNSTMLLEACLMGRPALSIGYVKCDQLWHKEGGLPLVEGGVELEAGLIRALRERRPLLSGAGWDWIRWAFSPGEFDGASASRIFRHIQEHFPKQAIPRLNGR